MSTNTEDEHAPSLNLLGDVFHGMFTQAWRLFREGKVEESEGLCRQLLAEPALGDFHKAGVHLLLAHGANNYVWHAEQAVDLYGNLLSGYAQPTADQLRYHEEMLQEARKVLGKAQEDQRKSDADNHEQVQRFLQHFGPTPTYQELIDADLEQSGVGIDQYLEALDRAQETMDRQTEQENQSREHAGDADAYEDLPVIEGPMPSPAPPIVRAEEHAAMLSPPRISNYRKPEVEDEEE